MLLATLLAGGCAGPAPPAVSPAPEPQAPPNVLLVLLDDVGTDKVSAYEEHPTPVHTPAIDGLADSGLLFRNAYAYPICGPARAALLTGRSARRTGMGENIEIDERLQLPLDELLLPEALWAAPDPWDDAAIGKWHLAGRPSTDGPMHPLRSGFRTHKGALGNLSQYTYWQRLVDGTPELEERYATTVQVDDALDEIEVMAEPWLLYLAFSAPHTPFHRPPEELTTTALPVAPGPADLQRAMLEALDTELGRLLTSIEPEVRDRTLVVVMGDNGTTERAVEPPRAGGQAKLTVYEGGVNVPLVVSGPGVVRPGREVDELVHITDLFPTVTELARVPDGALVDGGGQPVVLDGISLVPLLEDRGADWPREQLVVERMGPVGPPPYAHDRVAVRDERYKYKEVVVDLEPPVEALFDLDRGGFVDGRNLLNGVLTSGQEERLEALREAVERHRELAQEGG